MVEVINETLLDTIKLLPFLFVAFLILEYLEHKITKKNIKVIKKSGKFGPILGSILGAFPQCGFSVLATNLYAARVITLGTLISIYLSTSDEMIPLMIAQNIEISVIIKILLIKIIIGFISGTIIDLIITKKEKIKLKEFCEEEHCHCEQGIIKSSIKHTINITIFILIASFILNTVIFYIGEDNLSNLFIKNDILGPMISSLIGLIPNCASSVIITELYLNNIINFGSMLAGLLTGSGVAIMILFRVNKDIKENIKIIFTIYSIGVISGIILNFIGFIV